MLIPPSKRTPFRWELYPHRSGIPDTWQITSVNPEYGFTQSSKIVRVYKRKKWYTVKTQSGSVYKLYFDREDVLAKHKIEEVFNVIQ